MKPLWNGRPDDVVLDAQTILEARVLQGLSRMKLAHMASCSMRTIERVERGKDTRHGKAQAAVRREIAERIVMALALDPKLVMRGVNSGG